MKEALYFTKIEDDVVKCNLCPHNCIIHPEKSGICKVRHNSNGVLIADTFGIIASSSLDHIEKKPLYHFHPGKMIYSIGSYGCNLKCLFCQNHEISQVIPANIDRYRIIEPSEVVARASIHPNNIGIAFTYNEPSISFEYMLEITKISKVKGLKNVMVSNGFINPEPLSELLNYIDAFNIDLKAFSDDFYKKHTGGKINPILENLKSIKRNGNHLEVTFLVIPELNDNENLAKGMFKWISTELGNDTILHLSRYYPSYKLNNPATPTETLYQFYELAKDKLNYVYLGNTSHSPFGHDTICPSCSKTLIVRNGHQISNNGFGSNGCCINCGFGPIIVVN